MNPPIPTNESRRLEALRSYQILDTAPEPMFDDVALLASSICGTPIALMSLVDSQRQWFKARVGLDTRETPREHAFCAYTILGVETMVVEDASTDERFAQNPLVTSPPHIRFYAGAPLIDRDGNALGALCVIDRKPRHLADLQRKSLETLGRTVVAHLELKRVSAQLAESLSELTTVRGLLPICAECKKVRDDKGYWQEVESYITSLASVRLTHGLCPECKEAKMLEFKKERDLSNTPLI
ncbi:MAG: GAF domain-containing protein [Verrucomicrobiota bacterium]|jgi:GAF domain-containing protein